MSVIIPTFNSAAVLPRALASALAQTHRVLEVLVVNDGSTDHTPDVVVAACDARVRLLNRPNGGPAAARMTGLAAARGEWIALLDADDEWLPDKLALQLHAAAAANADAVFCANRSFTSGHAEIACYPGSTDRRDLLPALLCANVLSGGGSTALIRRDAFDRVGGFDPSVNASEDRDLFIRLADRCRLAYVPTVLATLHPGPIRYGSNVQRNLQNSLELIRRHAHRIAGFRGARRILRRARAKAYERAGLDLLFSGQPARAWPHLRRALLLWPLLPNTLKAAFNHLSGRRRAATPAQEATR